MARSLFGACLCLLLSPAVLKAQQTPALLPDRIATVSAPDPFGGAGAGQAAPSAFRNAAFTRLTLGASVSSLGTGLQLGSNVNPWMDLRLFGNYLTFNKDLSQSGFAVNLNLEMANTGAKADFYPLRRLPLRFSPGFLYVNQDRARVDFHAGPNATMTINDIDWYSDNADPIYGTARLTLGGTGFMATTGWGHIVSHGRRHFTFPFEAGVALIRSPVASIYLNGEICQSNQTQCQPAATFPTFQSNLAAQLATWNRDAHPFHIYPILDFGVAYTFRLNR